MIYTHRLTLRPLTLADAPFMLTLLNDPGFVQHIGDRGVRDLAGAEQHLQQGPLKSYQQYGFGLRAMEHTATKQLIGICGLLQREQLDAPDLGYALLEPYQQQGFAYEAAKAVLQWAVTLRIPSLYAIVNEDNTASQALLHKLGFAYHSPFSLTPEQTGWLYQRALPTA
ncbi:GNAT family N-acetyltransferase [Rheinheimera sp. UJ51]|uniref:GNAT family N-acetyltransferase n=1 Tax=unclassified Rheinheimera TaxID=115860 RepID=UPI001E2B4540|nr:MULTISPECIES: GNAT family N-acetyltransferase [unclassified Rheinheimera]MCC5452364.1 GNAT family N-acetyltransferase [Rheinheimera sp. UJ51]MCF4008862.1 GNAT family N-acetyltransferase [Rheinheimera sp. UJ63]